MIRDNQVLLIKKARPNWQAGRYNGVGGKIEADETPMQAMRREFKEEAGNMRQNWLPHFARLDSDDYVVYCFVGFCGSLAKATSMTDEPVSWHHVNNLPSNTLQNVRWLIPLALDHENRGVVSVYYASDESLLERGGRCDGC